MRKGQSSSSKRSFSADFGFRSELLFFDRLDRSATQSLSELCDVSQSVVIIDRKVWDSIQAAANSSGRTWLKKFPVVLKVQAGEQLKSISAFQRILTQIDRNVGDRVARSWTIVAIGGGSVGDFAGFLASVYKRGLSLIHVPSTWLAAVDSAHGGKTALNGLGAKNQIGTFYPAKAVLLIKEILAFQKDLHVRSAMGGVAKAALLSGSRSDSESGSGSSGSVFASLVKSMDVSRSKNPNDQIAVQRRTDLMWSALPSAIDIKMSYVDRDPFERTGERFALNLGHTFGHCLESHARVPHGLAVGAGLRFMLDVSLDQKSLSRQAHAQFNQLLDQLDVPSQLEAQTWLKKRPWNRKILVRLLAQDKKAIGTDRVIRFVVLEGFGRTSVRFLTAEELVAIAHRFGWIK